MYKTKITKKNNIQVIFVLKNNNDERTIHINNN